MKKEVLMGIGTVAVVAVVKEVTKIAWGHYKKKALEHAEVMKDADQD